MTARAPARSGKVPPIYSSYEETFIIFFCTNVDQITCINLNALQEKDETKKHTNDKKREECVCTQTPIQNT